MGLHGTCLNIFLFFMLILVVIFHSSIFQGVDAKGSGARKLGNKIWQQVQAITTEKTRDSYSNILKVKNQSEDTTDQIDPSLQIFFKVDDLKVGKTIPIYFNKRNPSSTPHFLPQKQADSIPFSSSHLFYLLNLFSFTKDSPQAKAIQQTLHHCEFEPLKGEIKFCATSLESLLSLSYKALGNNTKIKVLTTTHLTKSKTQFQNYTILEDAREILVEKVLGCHPMPYPYAVFYCHCQEGGNKLFQVLIRGDDGEIVDALGVCHMDTSQWDPNHAAFRVLGFGPGQGPVCHFFPADNLVWVPVKASA